MSEESELKQKIDDFLLGRMNEGDKVAFQKQIKEDPVLEKEVALQQKIIRGIKAFNNQELKARLKEIHKQVASKPEEAPRLHPVYRYAAAAASLLFLTMVAYWMFQPKGPADLYQAYYEPYSFAAGSRDANEKLLVEASTLYQQEQFQAALPKLDSLTKKDPDSLDYQLALGICYMEIGANNNANAIFQGIIQNGNALYVDQARWYLALSLLKGDQKNEARDLLNILTQDSNADHYEEAIRLLDALN